MAPDDGENDEIRQNIIPLSKQYMTIEAAQADIANIPEGSSTYVRSQDGSSLADEYINNGGTLTATGRKMPSGAAVELMSDTVQRLMTALHVMAEGGTSSGSGIESSDTVQNLMTGFNVLAESINTLSVGNQQNASGLSVLVSSVQICTEMLNTLAAEIVTPDGASQYCYVAFSVPGTVNAGNGSFGTDTRYRRTGMIRFARVTLCASLFTPHRQPQATQLRFTMHRERMWVRWGLCARRMRRIRHGITSVKFLRMALLSLTRWTRAHLLLLM